MRKYCNTITVYEDRAVIVVKNIQTGEITGSAFVDLVDLPLAQQHTWLVNVAGFLQTGPPSNITYLHRTILGLHTKDKMKTEHIDGNKENCRRANLKKWSVRAFRTLSGWGEGKLTNEA